MQTKIQGYCNWLVYNESGVVDYSKSPTPNLIVNNGLNEIGKRPIADCFSYLYLGSGSSPSNETQLNLDSEFFSTNNYRITPTTANQKISDSLSVTLRRTFEILSSDLQEDVDIGEIGFSYTDGAALFSRIDLDSPINLRAGDGLLIQYDVRVFMDPVSPLLVSDPISGLNTTGRLQFQFDGLAGINSDGTTNATSSITDNSNEPSQPAYGFISTDDSSPAPFGNAVDRSAGSTFSTGLDINAYVNGSYYRDKVFSVPSGDYNQSWSSFGVGGSSEPEKYTSLVYVADQSFEKTGNFDVTFRYSWGRYPPEDSALPYQSVFYNLPPENSIYPIQNPLLTFFDLIN